VAANDARKKEQNQNTKKKKTRFVKESRTKGIGCEEKDLEVANMPCEGKVKVGTRGSAALSLGDI